MTEIVRFEVIIILISIYNDYGVYFWKIERASLFRFGLSSWRQTWIRLSIEHELTSANYYWVPKKEVSIITFMTLPFFWQPFHSVRSSSHPNIRPLRNLAIVMTLFGDFCFDNLNDTSSNARCETFGNAKQRNKHVFNWWLDE